MVVYYCCGCRAQYPAQPKRCPRCKGRSFTGVNDDAPTTALLSLDDAPIVVPENLDGELAAAFAEAERFRLAALSGSPYTRPAPPVAPEPPNVPATSFAPDDAPPTPRDMPEPARGEAYDPALSVFRTEEERKPGQDGEP